MYASENKVIIGLDVKASAITLSVVFLAIETLVTNLSEIWINAFNSSPPSAAYMRHWTGSALVQIMACRLFDTKPLSKPILRYCQLDPWEQTSMKF